MGLRSAKARSRHGKPSPNESIPRIGASWKRNLERSLREKVDTFDEYRIVLPDGTVKHLRTIRHPVLNSAGEVVKLVGTSIDITEHKRGEEERETLRRLEAELAHANRLTTMGELTASIAHEVNQPLGAMVANAAACTRWLAAEPPETVKARRALDSIAADGRRASEIIGRIRALVKHQAPRKDSIDVNVKIAQVIELAADEIRRNGIVLRTELAEGLPHVHGDRVQLQQVLLNLILNAIDAMGPIQTALASSTIVSRRDGADASAGRSTRRGPRHRSGRTPRKCSSRSIRPSRMGWASGCPSAARSSRRTAASCGFEPNQPHGAIFRFSLPGRTRPHDIDCQTRRMLTPQWRRARRLPGDASRARCPTPRQRRIWTTSSPVIRPMTPERL